MKGLALLLALALALVLVFQLGDPPDEVAPPAAASRASVERGQYLVRAANCLSCHTQRGGEPYAGGRPIETPFGTLYSSNITPDPETGIGRWSADDLWRCTRASRATARCSIRPFRTRITPACAAPTPTRCSPT